MTKVFIYKEDKLSVSITTDKMKEIHPEWDGKLGLHDRFYIEDKEVQVTGMNFRFDDDEVDVHVKELK